MPMTASVPAETALAPPVGTALRRYELTTTRGSEVLMRVIGLVRRRCGEVVTLEFRSGDRHRPQVLELAVAIDPRQGSSLGLRLAGLIDVMTVREY